MSRPTFEIVRVVATDAYIADPTAIHEVAGMLTKTPGCLASWHGLDVQEPKYLWLVVAWETIEHHQAVIADKQQYPVVMAALGKACKEMVFLYHAKFSGDLYKTLNAPLTKFAIWTVKESADRARFHEALSQLVAKTPSNESEGISAGGLGEVIEDQRKFFASLGWQSMDHFNAVVAAAPQVAEQHDALKKLGADVEYKFVKFTKYSA